MKGYPKHISTKQDLVNLLTEPELRARALTDLKAIRDLQDDTIIVARNRKCLIDVHEEREAGEIPNLFPRWKLFGFASRQEVSDLVDLWEGK